MTGGERVYSLYFGLPVMFYPSNPTDDPMMTTASECSIWPQVERYWSECIHVAPCYSNWVIDNC
jgi:hypothetical protein